MTWCLSMRSRVLLVFAVVALAGCAKAGGTILGKDPGSATATPVSRLAPNKDVTVAGVMFEKCPAAGCWFMLRDKSGVIRVDTKAAGFTVTDVPVNTEVIVKGTLKKSGERLLVASGLRF